MDMEKIIGETLVKILQNPKVNMIANVDEDDLKSKN